MIRLSSWQERGDHLADAVVESSTSYQRAVHQMAIGLAPTIEMRDRAIERLVDFELENCVRTEGRIVYYSAWWQPSRYVALWHRWCAERELRRRKAAR